jgi:hypothetical protein
VTEWSLKAARTLKKAMSRTSTAQKASRYTPAATNAMTVVAIAEAVVEIAADAGAVADVIVVEAAVVADVVLAAVEARAEAEIAGKAGIRDKGKGVRKTSTFECHLNLREPREERGLTF